MILSGKSVLFNDDREVITIVLVFTYRPIIVKKQYWMTEGKINRCKRLWPWRVISVRLIIHNTYVIFCNEIFDKFASGIIILTTPEDIVTIEVTL